MLQSSSLRLNTLEEITALISRNRVRVCVFRVLTKLKKPREVFIVAIAKRYSFNYKTVLLPISPLHRTLHGGFLYVTMSCKPTIKMSLKPGEIM